MILFNVAESHILIEVIGDQSHVPDSHTCVQAEEFCQIKIQILLEVKEKGESHFGIYLHIIEIDVGPRQDYLSATRPVDAFLCSGIHGAQRHG
jgi:hypothetical protein